MTASAALWAAERLWGPGCAAPEHRDDLFALILGKTVIHSPVLLCGAGLGRPALTLAQAGLTVDAHEADATLAQEAGRRIAQSGAAAQVRLRDGAALKAAQPQDRYKAVIALRWPGPPDAVLGLLGAALTPCERMIVFTLADTFAGAPRSTQHWLDAARREGFLIDAPRRLDRAYRQAVMDGLSRRVATIASPDGGRNDPQALAMATEPWLRRVAALDAGRLAAMRFAFLRP